MKKYLLLLLLIVLVVLQKANAQPPVAYYPLNGNANDISGNVLNGTITGTVTPAADRFGNTNSAGSFNGASRIDVADNPLLRSANLTVSAWVFSPVPIAGTQIIAAKNLCNGPLESYTIVHFNGQLVAGWSDGNPSEIITAPGLTPGVWHMVTFTFDDVNNLAVLYVDGVAVGSSVTNMSLLYDHSTFSIGSELEECVHSFPLSAIVDEVKIFNTALTAAQVYNEMGNEFPLPVSTLAGGINGTCANSNLNNMNGGNASGFGCGGGGAGWYGGNGGHGNFGGGGGGAAGLGQPNKMGGNGGNGAVVVQMNNALGNMVSRKLYINGTQFTVPANVAQIKVWAIGAGGGGAGATSVDATSGGGGGAGGTAFKIFSVNSGDIISYTIGTGGIGGVDANSGNAGTATSVTLNAITITGNGGSGGSYNNGVDAAGGTFSGGDGGSNGGSGKGVAGDAGGGGGGGIGGANASPEACSGGIGANSINISNLFQIISYVEPIQKPGSGNAISFDGVDDHINTTAYVVPTSGDFTVEFWVFNRNNVGFREFISQGASGDAFYIGIEGVSNIIRCGDNWQVTGAILPLNKWIHVSMTKTGTNATLYLNGMQVAAQTGYTISAAGTTTVIGKQYGSITEFPDASLDELRVWNTALTQTQIRDRMCRKVTATDALYSNLVAYYNFDENTGNTAFDGTANANNGTLTNSPTRVTSGAAIGTASNHDYVNATKTTNLTHSTGESFTVTSTSGNPDGIQVYRVDEKPSDLTGATGVGANDKYFGVFQVNGTTPQYTAVYNYTGNPTINAGNESPVRLNKRTDNAATSWSTMAALPNEAANTITVAGESTEYILGSIGNPLPLNLISFAGNKKNSDALLQWKTANEVNVSRFELQRSDNGQNFVTIGTVSAGGNNYSYTDAGVFNNRQTVYYRLKSVDIDGRFTQSSIIRLQKTSTGLITVFPNPATDKIAISGLKQSGTVRLYDGTGKLLQQQIITAQTVTMDLSGYAKGMYLLQYDVKGEMANLKIIRQ